MSSSSEEEDPTSPGPTDPNSSTPPVGPTPQAQSALESLSQILGEPFSPSLSLLDDTHIANSITIRLRQPLSGAGDDNICRWLYDTFQSSDPQLQLAVLKFLPTLAGVYLIRAVSRKPLAGFEAVLLALYAHVTKSRAGQPVTVTIPDLSHPSLYHETTAKMKTKNIATELHIAVLSPVLEPQGTVRSTKRGRIVGVALELYYSKISQMPVSSKLDLCEFCEVWAGQYDHLSNKNNGNVDEGSNSSINDASSDVSISGVGCIKRSVREECGEKGGRIPLPWELLQPCLRILAHCVLAPTNLKELKAAAMAAVQSLHVRALHDIDPQAILATESLLKLGKREMESINEASDSIVSSDFQDTPESLVVFSN
ncbi:hyccin [Cinnamomum micranthum f. kanehirae]|uniref:Hyccin n=1 Tax=Cinnamomum micranthum f. kanehirae TaxID=337451 RepID=A0A443NBC5_9MAGN|nr:hyccin [Cinnamomum micranthum f. kanehirae]